MKQKQNIIFLLFTLLAVGCSKEFASVDYKNGAERYIVVLNKQEVQLASKSLGSRQSIAKRDVVQTMMHEIAKHVELPSASHIYSAAIEGGVYELNQDQVEKLSQDPRVAYIEKDQYVSINAMQSGATWGLDRLDQTALPLNHSYAYPSGGATVNVYVIDTGILTTHQQFQGRADSAVDYVDGSGVDCNGHGTHVAGTIGSVSYGVAKNVLLHAVRVLDCEGGGSFSDVIAGVDWVTYYHVSPAVANMSLGGSPSKALDDAIKASIRSGVTYAVAAGNESGLACNSSPGRISTAIVTGSTTDADARSSFSNYGSCVSVFAPGSSITSTWLGANNNSINTISGTSMASPHVAGVAALYLSQYPSATPAQVKAAIIANSIAGRVSDAGSGSPNLLLNTQFLGAGDNSGAGEGGNGDSGVVVPPVPPKDDNSVCVDCEKYSGSFDKKGQSVFQPEPSFKVASGVQTYILKGPSGTDFDLYLYKQNGSSWTQVASAVKKGSDEQISYQGGVGTYRLKVVAYSGSGKYELYRKLP